jgi:hypothetical protein
MYRHCLLCVTVACQIPFGRGAQQRLLRPCVMPICGSAVVAVLRVCRTCSFKMCSGHVRAWIWLACLGMADLPDMAGLHSTRGELNACAVLIVR